MSLVVNLTVGRLLSRNEKLTTAKLNAIVQSIVINITGSVGNADIVAGAITAALLTQDAYFDAPAVFDGSQTYTAAFNPAITAYTDGLVVSLKCDTQNPGPVLVDTGAGPVPVRKHGGRRELDAGDVVANGRIELRYNSTLGGSPVWELMSLPGRPVETTPLIGASAYLAGLAGIPAAPNAGQQGLYLRGDGTWADAVGTATAAAAAANSTNPVLAYLNFI